MIDIKGLYKSFDDKTVLSDINATFENGKTNLIIGQSGSGKTVLMKCIVGLLTPEKGEVLYDGRNLVLMGKKEKKMLRKEMGMIFQSAALFDSMTGGSNTAAASPAVPWAVIATGIWRSGTTSFPNLTTTATATTPNWPRRTSTPAWAWSGWLWRAGRHCSRLRKESEGVYPLPPR